MVLTLLPSFASTATHGFPPEAEDGNAEEAADTLLKWKSTLDNQSRSLLWSWRGENACSSNWTGITCYGPRVITSLNLSNMGLRGAIPTSIGILGNLTLLGLMNNNLSG
ncbi:hypothetical protein NL676_022093 [Syzygium grande]|nr:hypothetical protein NL676_022093 [Syzygium grande]